MVFFGLSWPGSFHHLPTCVSEPLSSVNGLHFEDTEGVGVTGKQSYSDPQECGNQAPCKSTGLGKTGSRKPAKGIQGNKEKQDSY